jgi:hypothetical protein
MGSTAKQSAVLGSHTAVACKAAAVLAGVIVASFAAPARADDAPAAAVAASVEVPAAPVAEAPAVEAPAAPLPEAAPAPAADAPVPPAVAPPAAPVAAPPVAPAAPFAMMPAAPASADKAPAAGPPRHRTFGMTMDVGVPDGAALGLVVRPHFDWLRIAGAVTHNGIAPGVRVGVTLDPIAFPIAPTLTFEAGHYWEGKLPMIQDSPTLGYNYANIHLGLEIGNRATFRFFLRGGVSYLDVNASNINMGSGSSGTVAANGSNAMSGSGIGNPSFSGWVAPSGKLGFSLYF